jgi:hypothetical protein
LVNRHDASAAQIRAATMIAALATHHWQIACITNT